MYDFNLLTTYLKTIHPVLICREYSIQKLPLDKLKCAGKSFPSSVGLGVTVAASQLLIWLTSLTSTLAARCL